MGGTFSVGGLISGLNTNSLIEQLMQFERQPIFRVQRQIADLEAQQSSIMSLRTQLLTVRNRAQDFQLSNVFSQFESASSEESVLTAQITGQNPVIGSYAIDVTQLASATVANSSAALGQAINPAVALDSSGINGEITAGQFSINGVAFTVDPTADTLTGILNTITASSAGVTATYDAVTDTVVIANTAAGDTDVINFGGTGDDSNFLSVINVTQATQADNGSGSTEVRSTRNLGAIDPATALNTTNFAAALNGGTTFRVNGVEITIDPTTDTLSDVIGRINDSAAGVSASYDTSSDTIRVVSETLGSRTISFTSETSNLLDVLNLTAAVQTAGSDAEFSINGGAPQTRNTNEVSDAIGGVTLTLLSLGSSTVSVASDEDAIIEGVQEFLDEFNTAIADIRSELALDSALENDMSLRIIENYLRNTMIDLVAGVSGDFSSLVDIGISSGEDFDANSTPQLVLDAEAFREALEDDRAGVQFLFANSGETGAADKLFAYLDDVTEFSGFLNERAKANGIIDQQIDGLNQRIEGIERRVSMKEERLRRQFAQMEMLQAGFQTQGSALASIASSFRF